MNILSFDARLLAMRISQQLAWNVLVAEHNAHVAKHGPLTFASPPTPDNWPSDDELAENDEDCEDY